MAATSQTNPTSGDAQMPAPLRMSDGDRMLRDAPLPSFVCNWSSAVGVAWIEVAGELDIATSPQLERALAEVWREADRAVLDLRELVFLAVSGVHVIVDASIAALRDGRRLTVVRASARVDAVFTLTSAAAAVDFVELEPGQPVLAVVPQWRGVSPVSRYGSGRSSRPGAA